MKILLFLLIFVSLNLVVAAISQKCAAVSNYYKISRDGYNASASYKFSVNQSQGKNFITVSEINVNITGVGALYTCVVVNNFEQACFTSLPNSTTFSTDNSTISVMTVFNETIMFENFVFLGGGIIDEGSFSDGAGSQYTVDRPCISYSDMNDTSFNITSCCTSFTTPLPESPINAPVCNKFKSRSTVYNVTDNYNIIATTKVNYMYANETIFANVSFSGLNGWFIQLAANMDNDCSGGRCSFDGPRGDGKIILRMENFNGDIQLPGFFIGRIILRNNQTLMEEGIPFTKQNDCFYYSQTLLTNLVASSSFCCVDFA